jgi:serine/threonine protein kinase
MKDISIGAEQTLGPGGKSGGHAYALKPGEALGQYRVIRQLGAGGMGEVYEAENTVNRKRVALKVLSRSAMGGTSIDRFRIESRVMMDLRHPHVVQVHHAGEEQGLHYLTMDLVLAESGEPYTLEHLLKDRGKFPESEVQAAAEQICSALEHAHAKGLIHRDLKPANVLIAEDGTLRVSDFGLAKVVGEDYLHSMIERSVGLSMQQMSVGDQRTAGGATSASPEGTSTHALLGTYDYMSPEQKAGGEISVQSDIYALGVILYRMLTGEKPEGRWKPPSKFGLSKRWDAIIERCMERDLTDRFASVATLKLAIQQVGRALLPSRVLAAVALFAPMAAVGFWVLSQHTSSPEPDEPPAPVVEEEAEPVPRVTLADIAPVKAEADRLWRLIADYDRGHGIGGKIDQVDRARSTAEILFQAADYSSAFPYYQDAIDGSEALMTIERVRTSAQRGRASAVAAQKKAVGGDAERDAAALWLAAIDLLDHGNASFDQADYDAAETQWAAAKLKFEEAATRAASVQAQRDEREDAIARRERESKAQEELEARKKVEQEEEAKQKAKVPLPILQKEQEAKIIELNHDEDRGFTLIYLGPAIPREMLRRYSKISTIELMNNPQRYWSLGIIFEDVLEDVTHETIRYNGRRLVKVKAQTLGWCYIEEEAVDSVRDLLLNHRREYWGIVVSREQRKLFSMQKIRQYIVVIEAYFSLE